MRPITPRRERSFFVGWAPEPPTVDRRFLLASGLGLVALGAGAGGALAFAQERTGRGTWDQGDVRDFVGELILEPYPALRVIAQMDLDGVLRTDTALPKPSYLGCMGKCGVQPRLAQAANASELGLIAVRGSLIARGDNTMITVADGPDWVRPVDPTNVEYQAIRMPLRAREGVEVDLGPVTLSGEILDIKCSFGAMRPASGKEHKACAALCIRSGLPPAFYAKDREGRGHVFLLTDAAGGPLSEAVAPLAGEPVRAPGRLVRRDFVEFRVDPAAIARV